MTDLSSFAYQAAPARVVFGAGSVREIASEVLKLRLRRILVLTTPGREEFGREVAALLVRGGGAEGGPGIEAEVYPHAVMHVPVDLADRAAEHATQSDIDGCVAVGGGSAIGLGKAIALRTGLPFIAVPTTYAGSEMTPIWGLTQDGRKTTGKDARVFPRTVIYDPELTLNLPVGLSTASAVNALAHAAEALYAPDVSPLIELIAEESARALCAGLSKVVADPTGLEGRSETLYGAWLAGMCLSSTTPSLHHKLCHVLGGAFNLPHAETHALLLPHVLRHNLPAAPRAEAALRRAFAADDVAVAVHDLTSSAGLKGSLRELGMPEDGVERAVRLAVAQPYANPTPVTADMVRSILRHALAGGPPRAAGVI